MSDNHRRYRSIRTALAQMYLKEPKGYTQYLRQLRGRNWFKNGMNHAQASNLLENLSQ